MTTSQFEVWTDPGNIDISLIDRSETGDVSTFTVSNGAGSFAATDIFPANGSGVARGFLNNVDFNSPEGDELAGEYVVTIVSSARVFGGGPLHGDTVASHLTLTSSATPHVQVDIDLQSSGGTGTGLFDPFAYMVGDAPEFTNSLNLNLQLKPEPAVDGVDSALQTDFQVDVSNLYDVRAGTETITPTLLTNNAVTEFLLATESLEILTVLDYLDSVSDYLQELQTQSRLADNLPGLSKGVGDLFDFADSFQARIQQLRELPEDLRPKSLQELNSRLSAPISGADLAAELRFDSGIHTLLLDLNLDFDAITAEVPLSLDLTKLGLDRTALGLQKVAAIVDTLNSGPVDVQADGSINVALGIGLADPTMPSPFLSGVTGSGSATGAAFTIEANNNDGMVFITLLGSLPAEVVSGLFILDSDGDGPATTPATYTVDLQSNANLRNTADAVAAASDASSAITIAGHELPFVGNQLADAADFLLQMRDSVVDNLNLYGSTLTVESVRQGLFDAFGPGGFDWLQNDPDTNDQVVNLDDVKVVTQTIPASGRELVVGVEYELDLVGDPARLASPVDVDLLLPGLGLKINSVADVMFGFHLPLSVGVSIADGVYVDVESTNDLEISLDVALPQAAARLTNDPRLVFTNPADDAPTITRERGNWILDGFTVGQIIQVSGTESNDGDYLIASIDSTGLNLILQSTDAELLTTDVANDRVVPEGPSSGIEVEVLEISQLGRPNLVFIDEFENQVYTFPKFTNLPDFLAPIDLPDTITRDTGNWYADGFRVGDAITVSGTPSNDGEFTIIGIDPSGRRVTVDGVLNDESAASSLIRRDHEHALAGHLGVLPFRIEDLTRDQSELTGTFVIDLLDPSVVGGNQRLSVNDLIAQAPFSNVPQAGFTAAPLPQLMTITEAVGHELTVHPISLLLETDLPTGAAFPPYRMQLDVTNWDWDLNDSLATEASEPTVEMNDVQFELIGFVRDLLGASITRTSKAKPCRLFRCCPEKRLTPKPPAVLGDNLKPVISPAP